MATAFTRLERVGLLITNRASNSSEFVGGGCGRLQIAASAATQAQTLSSA
jgi:hypothetical protein